MTSANERQVGGEHYKRKFQHWDLMALAGAGYFSGQVTKYAERHSRKNGREDLEKALHFAEKMHEVNVPTVKVPQYRRGLLGRKVLVAPTPRTEDPRILPAVRDYAVEAGLTALQERIFEFCLLRPDDTETIVALCRKHLNREYPTVVTARPEAVGPIPTSFVGELSPAQEIMKREMLERYEAGPATPEDGGQHEVAIIPLNPEAESQIGEDFSNAALENALATQRSEHEVEYPTDSLKRTPPEKASSRKK